MSDAPAIVDETCLTPAQQGRSFPARIAWIGAANMQGSNGGVKVIDVAGLGMDGVIVNVAGKRLLLVEAGLTFDERVAVMSQAMTQESSG